MKKGQLYDLETWKNDQSHAMQCGEDFDKCVNNSYRKAVTSMERQWPRNFWNLPCTHFMLHQSAPSLLPVSPFPPLPSYLPPIHRSTPGNSSNEPKHKSDAFFCGYQHQDLISLSPSFSTSAVCDPVETITFKRSKNTLLSFVRYQISQKCYVFKRH